jgi:hypothetical protein
MVLPDTPFPHRLPHATTRAWGRRLSTTETRETATPSSNMPLLLMRHRRISSRRPPRVRSSRPCQGGSSRLRLGGRHPCIAVAPRRDSRRPCVHVLATERGAWDHAGEGARGRVDWELMAALGREFVFAPERPLPMWCCRTLPGRLLSMCLPPREGGRSKVWRGGGDGRKGQRRLRCLGRVAGVYMFRV